MSFWEKIKGDLEQGIAEGIDIAKESAAFVKKRAKRLTEAAKDRLSLFELKIQVRREMAELGGHVYDLKDQAENPLSDDSVKEIVERIRGLENQIGGIEGKAGGARKEIRAEAERKEGEGNEDVR